MVNIWDIILSALIFVAVVMAVVHIVRTKKRGGSACCGDCSNCVIDRSVLQRITVCAFVLKSRTRDLTVN